jgi:hypothetical protein
MSPDSDAALASHEGRGENLHATNTDATCTLSHIILDPTETTMHRLDFERIIRLITCSSCQ